MNDQQKRYLYIQELKELCTNPLTNSEKLTNIIPDILKLDKGTRHFLFDKLVQNPNIAFKDWIGVIEERNQEHFAERALQNPAVDLWLLEDPAQWEKISQRVAELFLKIKNLPASIRELCERAIENAKKNGGSFSKFVFPVLRRVFPNLIAHELVSVQPLTQPIGAVHFLDYIYGNKDGNK